MPKDNHSLMQLFLDGKNNNFYLFFVNDSSTNKINNSKLLKSHFYLKNKNFKDIVEPN